MQFTLVETADADDTVIAVYLGQAASVNGINVALPKFWSDPLGVSWLQSTPY